MIRNKKDYQNLSAAELAAKAVKLNHDIAKARVDIASEKTKNVRLVFNLRKQLAQVKSYASNLR